MPMVSPSSLSGPGLNITELETIPVNIVHGTHGELVAFLVLNMWPSHLGIPILLAIAIFSKRVKRHPTFINLCVSFIIIGILYAGRITGPEPSQMLCLFQASLLYGMPPLTSMTAFTLVLQMFLVIRSTYYGREYLDRDHVIRLWAILIAPYAAFMITILATAIVGAANPDKVTRNRRFFYCSVESLPLTNTLTIFAAIVCLATCVLEVWTTVILIKRWILLKKKGLALRSSMDLGLPLRILGFGMYIVLAMSLGLISIHSPSSPVPDLLIATAATFLLIIFGSQADVVRALCFWRKDGQPVVKSQLGQGKGKLMFEID